jgi:signal transduction histidine kinase
MDFRYQYMMTNVGVNIARLIWIVLFIITILAFSMNLLVRYELFQTVCITQPSECTVSEQLSVKEADALKGVGLSFISYARYQLFLEFVQGLGYFIIALVIFLRKPNEGIALFSSIILLTFGASFNIDTLGEIRSSWQPAVNLIDLISSAAILFFYVFPDGRFVPRWTLYASFFWMATSVARIYFPGSFLDPFILPNWLNLTGWIGIHISCLYAQVHRYRHKSNPLQRQQTKWFVFSMLAFVVVIIGLILYEQFGLPDTVNEMMMYMFGTAFLTVASLIMPIAIGIAIFRYRLWDIDIIINRTLVYGTLTAIIVIGYVLLVGFLGFLFQSPNHLFISLVTTGFIAVVFQPIKIELQRLVNRAMFGDRDNPYTVLSRLGENLEAANMAEDILPTVVETVSQALRLPYAGIRLREGDSYPTTISFGKEVDGAYTIPLQYQGEQIGELILGPRATGEGFTSAEQNLLRDLIRQIGIAAHNVRLSLELQRSRERLVLAREEERRRIRRDLHDGLGPALASLSLKIDAAQNMIGQQHSPVKLLLQQMSGQVQHSITDIRTLVYSLRPPALDELGLLSALKELAEQYGESGLHFDMQFPDHIPQLPAAVEVAIYRILQEALTNVIRHSKATRCKICIMIDREAVIEVEDNGCGINEHSRAGVGQRSIRERAEELGGHLQIRSVRDEGTRVIAHLPLVLGG